MNHYTTACSLQRNITTDSEIVLKLQDGTAQPELVNQWMRGYGLFQGINSQERDAIVKAFLEYAQRFDRPIHPLEPEITEEQFTNLLTILHNTVRRGWMSATSKLLWCLHPYDFVIYDAFVHRALLVLQCVDSSLDAFDRIGTPPAIKSQQDIDKAIRFYMNYQGMVKKLLTEHQFTLNKLRQRDNESYFYDIRIIDKVLWMIGDPRRKY
jgi:hypothetical protein